MLITDMFRLRKVAEEVGIEIEMEGKNFPLEIANGRTWTAHHDGSLRGNGMEYVLAKPVNRDEVMTVLEFLSNYLKEHGTVPKIGDRCGVHVHVNCQKLNFNQVLSYITLYLILENLLVKFCGEDREGNLFCLRASDAEALIGKLRVCAIKQSFATLQDPRWRYAAINTTALSKFGSLEFRAMRTPNNLADIKTWVDLLLKVKDGAMAYSSPQAIVEDMSFQGSEAFLRNILGDAAELLQCPDMDDIVMDGVRRVQDLAYVQPAPDKKIFGEELDLVEFDVEEYEQELLDRDARNQRARHHRMLAERQARALDAAAEERGRQPRPDDNLLRMIDEQINQKMKPPIKKKVAKKKIARGARPVVKVRDLPMEGEGG